MPTTLSIQYVKGSNPPAFQLTRHLDGKSLKPVTITPPHEFPVPGQPNSHLMEEVRWYLERFLDYPFRPETVHADQVLEALKDWGTQAFNALFDRGNARSWLHSADHFEITSDDAGVLSWPWEALFDPLSGVYLAHERHIERRVNSIADPPPTDLPKDRVNILLVVPRALEGDVCYRSIARSLVELIRDRGLPAHVDILRPPTFKKLRAHLKSRPNFYHVLHFDGRLSFDGRAIGKPLPQPNGGAQGCLALEGAAGKPDLKSAADFSALLRDHSVPAVVLNGRRSGLQDPQADNVLASVATSLLQGGVRSVVAIPDSLSVSGARVFLAAFYERLFEAGSVAEAVRAGRRRMLQSKKRVCVRGQFPLEDWFVPALYQPQPPLELEFAETGEPAKEFESRLPDDVRDHEEPYGFIGRDRPLLEMERALHRKAPAILIQGMPGAGKTTLARGLLKWLDNTGGLDTALWLDFRFIHTADAAITWTGELLYDDNFGLAKDKLKLLGQAFAKQRAVIVWDKLEFALTNLTAEDRAQLRGFLEAIHGGKGKIIITGRWPEEDQLAPHLRSEVQLGGLDGDERWEYFDSIVHSLGLKVKRNDKELKDLMDMLCGHPLAMRVVVPELAEMPAAKVAETLRANISALGLSEQDEQGRLFGALRFVERRLSPQVRQLLALVGLHESYLEVRLVEQMANSANPKWTRSLVNRLIRELSGAGLLRDNKWSTYEIHPLFTSYLRARGEAPESCRRAFVDSMAGLAHMLASKPLREQRFPFMLHGANFHQALSHAEHLEMDEGFCALIQSFAAYVQLEGNLPKAGQLALRMADHQASRGDAVGEAIAYHRLGMIADEQHDSVRAQDWYLKAVAIEERRGNEQGAAMTYGQLGNLAFKQRDFPNAQQWYRKAAAIAEKLGLQGLAATSCHHLGLIAHEQGDFSSATKWYSKSFAIKDQQGDMRSAAVTLHALGVAAAEQSDYMNAKDWYRKSLTITEKLGIQRQAALTYHELGVVAQDEGEFSNAKEWYLKSLAIKEKQGDVDGAAGTCSELGTLAGLEKRFEEGGRWLVRSIAAYRQADDEQSVEQNRYYYRVAYDRATVAEQATLEAIWREAGLGPFPPPDIEPPQ